MRTTSKKAQRAITEAALATFRKRGYEPATLEEIGAQVHLTRGAVLHHFKSKGALLAAVVDPCRQALAQLSITTPPNDPPSVAQRRQLLTRFAEVFITHRETLGLLANDVSARVQLGLDDQWFMPSGQLVGLLAGSRANRLDRLRVAAAIGAMIQPVTSAWVDLESAKARAELVEAAMAVLHGQGVTASETVTQLGTTSPRVSASSVARVVAS